MGIYFPAMVENIVTKVKFITMVSIKYIAFILTEISHYIHMQYLSVMETKSRFFVFDIMENCKDKSQAEFKVK